MPVTINSPFSGKPIKVRDQDVGRAVRDEEGRIFYVLPKSDGSGFYGAPTRAGGPKDEARALEMENKMAVARGNVHDEVDAVHDATGRKRSGASGKLVVLFLFLVLAAILLLALWRSGGDLSKLWSPNPAPPSRIIEGGGASSP